MKIASVVGARPQFIKAAMVSRELRKIDNLKEVIVHTGQHYDDNMSRVFFEELMIPAPDYDLGVGSGTQGEQTAEILKRLERVLLTEEPDLVLVYGDTNSTLAGALAAAKLRIPVGHVEAGLRSYNRQMPEEINRVMSDHVSDYLFCPTQTAVANLASEGVTAGVYKVGDVMYDAALFYSDIADNRSRVLERLNVAAKTYYLATVHRAENTDELPRLASIFQALTILEELVIIPLHPRTRKVIENSGLVLSGGLKIIQPLSYLDMMSLERNAKLILTDSGGVQKEAYFFRVPCITLRNETEWPETVESGWNRIAGTRVESILEAITTPRCKSEGAPDNYFGTGDASKKICGIISRSATQEDCHALV